MAKKIFIGLLILIVLPVAVFAVVVAMQSPDFRIERSATIAAPPAEVFAQVNDFHNWDAWSPWAKLDTNAKNSFEGSSSGEGAILKWSGNDQVGDGQMTIEESRPNELIKIKLQFFKPMEGTATDEFTFKSKEENTVVTWAMYGQNNFVGRVFCTLFNMQKEAGNQFDKCLASIKSIVETKKTEDVVTKTTAEK